VPIRGRALLLKLSTDEGVTGFGEPMNYEHGRVVAQAVSDMADYLVGKDPLKIEDHWQVLYRSSYSRQMPILVSALSGIEMALWDVAGKVAGLPVWQLLGGRVRDRVRMYASVGGRNLEELRERARQRVEAGFTAVKLTPVVDPARYVQTPRAIDAIVGRVAAVREVVGDDVDVAVDLHRRVSPADAIVILGELEALKPLFVEEPCHPETTESLLRVSRSTRIPIATGERHLTRWGFREVIEREAAAVLQPDIRHAGGIAEMRKIAAMAEVHSLGLAPHNAAGPVGVAASLQVVATVPNFMICEGGTTLGEGLFRHPLSLKSGFVEIPEGPGLGIEIDDAAIEEHRDDEFRQRSMWRLAEDGSYADS
jgi:galactonate dehydratase